MIDYDSFSRCHLTDIFSRYFRGSKRVKEATCCPSAVVQGSAREKMVCVRGVSGATGTLGKIISHFNPTKRGRGPHHHVQAAVDW